ncbi:MAG: hypothetical protein D6737_14370 [Chloroflexi bacterium]|nr:MAG: hypothetical protein D6737_14370 [Chloroflexota bacterium]
MRGVVIIGGGLTGLAAAVALQQEHIAYTLIEVKPRLGGSIMTTRHDGFVLDGSPMLFERVGDWSLLREFGLDDALFVAAHSQYADIVGFKRGVGALVDALERRLTGNIIMRMAVSSIGRIDDCFTICLENGLMFNTDAIIMTAPARYAERILRTIQPESALMLLDYQYAHLARVSLGYPRETIRDLPELSDIRHAPYVWTDSPQRVPQNHLLLQVSIPVGDEHTSGDDLIDTALTSYHLPKNPVVQHVHYWPEADPLTRDTPAHQHNMTMIEQRLPDGMALVGSDYRAVTLIDRIAQGQEAARRVAAYLQK